MEKTLEHRHEIQEEQIILPLTQISDNVTSNPSQKQHQITTERLESSLQDLFHEQSFDEKDLKKTKEILGDLAKEFSDSELKDLVSQIQYLTESWLDEFEREIFDGLTLNEILHERSCV